MRLNIIGVLLLILGVVGCSGDAVPESIPMESDADDADQDLDTTAPEPADDADEEEMDSETPIDMTSFVETLAEVKLLGKSMYCEGSSMAQAEMIDLMWWFKGGKVRSESTFRGETQKVIMVDDTIYMSLGTQMKEMMEAEDCDWMKSTIGDEEADIPDVDMPESSYKNPEDVDVSNFKCYYRDVADSRFELHGTLCTMEDLMSNMMGDSMSSGSDLPADIKGMMP